MAAKKAAAKAAPEKADAPAPYLDPELARIRDEELAREPKVKVAAPEEPSIDPALVEQRKKDLAAPVRTIGSL
jgi:hypothetical protein